MSKDTIETNDDPSYMDVFDFERAHHIPNASADHAFARYLLKLERRVDTLESRLNDTVGSVASHSDAVEAHGREIKRLWRGR